MSPDCQSPSCGASNKHGTKKSALTSNNADMLANYYYRNHYNMPSSSSSNNEHIYAQQQQQQQRKASLPRELQHKLLENSYLSSVQDYGQNDNYYTDFDDSRNFRMPPKSNLASDDSFDRSTEHDDSSSSSSSSSEKQPKSKDEHNREASLTSNPPYEITEEDDQFHMSIDLPGVKARDIKVDYKAADRLLSVTARRKRKNRFETVFEEVFSVAADTIEVSKIRANLADGVLTLNLPKNEFSNEVQTIVVTEQGRVSDDMNMENDDSSDVVYLGEDGAMMMHTCSSPALLLADENDYYPEDVDGSIESDDDLTVRTMIDDVVDHEMIEL